MKDRHYLQKYQDELATALGDDPLISSEARTPEIIEELVVNTVRNLKSAANKTVPTKDFKPIRKHYWSLTLTSLNRKVKLCWRKWSHEGEPRDNRKQSFIDYKSAKRNFQKAQRQAIHENEIASFEQLERQHDKTGVNSTISKLKKRKGNKGDPLDVDGKRIDNDSELLDVWKHGSTMNIYTLLKMNRNSTAISRHLWREDFVNFAGIAMRMMIH